MCIRDSLTLRNRIMTTSHEPAYPEDGMPKDRYRLYHLERARAGVAMVMTAGSAAVSKDSPPVFNNVLAYKDEVVPWMRRIADDCHEAGAAVMIQLTHLGPVSYTHLDVYKRQAYTAVDKAEEDEATALLVNGTTPGALARAAAARDLPFVHVSSDYVFDGAGSQPFHPDDRLSLIHI